MNDIVKVRNARAEDQASIKRGLQNAWVVFADQPQADHTEDKVGDWGNADLTLAKIIGIHPAEAFCIARLGRSSST